MKCFMCKGEYQDQTSTFMVEIGKSIIIIRDVPSQVCTQCGEISYSTEVTKRLEEIVSSMKAVVAEIAVVHYPDAA